MPCDDAADDLAVDDHRIDHGAAVLGHDVVEQLDRAGVGIDGDHAPRACHRRTRRRNRPARRSPCCPAAAPSRPAVGRAAHWRRTRSRQCRSCWMVRAPCRPRCGSRRHRLAKDARRCARIFSASRRDALADGAAGEHDRARCKRAETVRADRGIAVADRNLPRIDAELVGGDLRQRGLVTLAVVLHAHIDDARRRPAACGHWRTRSRE